MALPVGRAKICEIRLLLPILLYVCSSMGAALLCVWALVVGKRVGEKGLA